MESILKRKTNIRKERPYSIFVLYVLLTSAIYLLPNTKVTVPYIIVASLMLISLALVLLNVKWMQCGLVLVLISLVLFFSNLIINDMDVVAGVNEIIRNMRFFIPVLWGCFALTNCNQKQRRVITVVTIIIIAVVIFNTLEALKEEPMIARVLAQDKTRDTTEINAYRLKNVAGYTFSYMTGLITIAFTWFTLKAKKKIYKIIGVILVIVCFYYIIQTMYTTLLILSVSSVVILVFLNSKSPITKTVTVIIGIIFLFNIETIFNFLSELFSFSSVLSIKFKEIYTAFKFNDIEAVGPRPQLIKTAIENWIKSPVFGSKNTNATHSLFFEILQNNGIVGVFSWLVLFIGSWRMLYVQLKSAKIDTTLFNVCMVYVSFLSVLNDIRGAFEITIVAFLFIPVISTVFDEIINEKVKIPLLSKKREVRL